MKTFSPGTVVAAILALTALPGFAGVTSCATGSPGSALNSFQAGNTPTLGCGNVDLGFNNFTAGGSVYDFRGNATTLSTAMVDIYSPSGPSPSPGWVASSFDVPGTPTWSLIDFSGVTRGTSNVGYQVTALNGTSGVTPPTSGGMWAISSLGLGATYSNANVPSRDSIVLHELICGGATSTTVGLGNCTANHLATITETITGGGTPTVTFSSSSLAGTVFTFDAATGVLTSSAGFTQIAIDDSVVLSRVYFTTVALTSFTNTFDPSAVSAPEPATFGLIGLALTTLIALGRRKS